MFVLENHDGFLGEEWTGSGGGSQGLTAWWEVTVVIQSRGSELVAELPRARENWS